MQLAQAVLMDIAGLTHTGQLLSDGPYVVTRDEAAFLADDAYTDCICRMASSPCFPFAVGDVVAAFRRAEQFYATVPAARPHHVLPPQYGHGSRLVLQVLVLAKRMAQFNRRFAGMAFHLSDAELTVLLHSGDLILFEAAAHVRLVFQSALFREVMATYVMFRSQKRKDRTGYLSQMARLAGLSMPRRVRGLA